MSSSPCVYVFTGPRRIGGRVLVPFEVYTKDPSCVWTSATRWAMKHKHIRKYHTNNSVDMVLNEMNNITRNIRHQTNLLNILSQSLDTEISPRTQQNMHSVSQNLLSEAKTQEIFLAMAMMESRDIAASHFVDDVLAPPSPPLTPVLSAYTDIFANLDHRKQIIR